MKYSKLFAGWVFGFSLAIFIALALGLLVVWSNIEQVDMAYSIKKLQTEISVAESHSDKLAVERDNLTSPDRLSRLAEDLGMHPARTGQQRKLLSPVNGASVEDNNSSP